MISQNTPPGTEVVCIDAGELVWKDTGTGIGSESGLFEGAVYTVSGWDQNNPPGVLLHERAHPKSKDWGFNPARFRYLHRAADPSFYAVERTKESANV